MPGFQGWLETSVGPVAVIGGELTFRDRFGAWKARWGIGRMSYLVPPGIYAVGAPDADAPVLVTANYKMSYDLVRSAVATRSLWLLVLETYGINVWCAAGKGTFGTGELVRRITATGLEKLVDHRRLILPIMGAAGVRGVEVARRTGFTPVFATLHAADLPEYLDHGQKTTPAMLELTFSFRERLALVPIELVAGLKSILSCGVPLALLAGFQGGGFHLKRSVVALACLLSAVFCGTVLVPLLLPRLPGRMFSVKGAVLGLAFSGALCVSLLQGMNSSWQDVLAVFFLVTSISSFFAMNFTGSTPFTSPSGVRFEMNRSLPYMAGAFVTGIVCLIWGALP